MPPELVDRAPRRVASQIGGHRHVGGHGECRAGPSPAPRPAIRSMSASVRAATHDVGAGFGEGDCGRGADALARARDDRDAAVESEPIENHGRTLRAVQCDAAPRSQRHEPMSCAVNDGVRRCRWGASTPDYAAYHDDEWGRPVVDDTRLYEKLCLEGFQSGLSWITILRKRENFRARVQGLRRGEGRALHRNATSNGCWAMPASCATGARSKRRSRTPERSTTVARASTDRSPRCCGRSSRPAAGRRRERFADVPASTPRVEGVLEGAAAARVPVRRADDGLRHDAVGRAS